MLAYHLAYDEEERRCTCCGRILSYMEWLALPLQGLQRDIEDEQGRPMVLELRNCSCGTTLATRVRNEP